MNKKQKILIYTDGSALGNPGPGGYGIVMKTGDGKHEKRLSKGFKLTTNNRMELRAVIDALKEIKDRDLPVEIYTDSKYVTEAVNQKWLQKWKSQRFAKTKNPDLWLDYLKASDGLDITFHWVKGHNGHPENEMCDKMAVKAAKEHPVHIDEAYEQMIKNNKGLF